jgi:cell division protein FtsQ
MTLPEASSLRCILRVCAPVIYWQRGLWVRQRGATLRRQQAVESPVHRAQWLRRLFTPMLLAKSLALGLLLLTALVGSHFVQQIIESPFREYVIEGDFKYLEQAEIGEVLAPFMGDDFVTLPLQTLRIQLEALPWVAGADLQRDWPDTLVLALEEQQPVARWGGAMLINRQGALFEPREARGVDSLPQLDGPVGAQAEVMARYVDLGRILGARDLAPRSLRLSARGSWSTDLWDGVELVIGRHRVEEKLQRFLALYDRVLEQYLPDIERIDLRYQNGVAVRWRSGTGPVASGESGAMTTMVKE